MTRSIAATTAATPGAPPTSRTRDSRSTTSRRTTSPPRRASPSREARRPFGAAICNSDPNRLILVWSQSLHHARRRRHVVQRRHLSGPRPEAQARAPPGSATAWSSPRPGTTTSTRSRPTATTSPTRTSAWPAPSTAARPGSGGTRTPGPPGGTPATRSRSIPKSPGKMWGAFSDVHDIPNDNIISERHGHNGPGGVCLSRDFGASWKPRGAGPPAAAGDLHRARSPKPQETRARSTPASSWRASTNPPTTARPGR